MTIRPCESTPPATGEICGRPSRRAVTSSNRWRGRTKSSSSASSTGRLVAMDLATKGPYAYAGAGAGAMNRRLSEQMEAAVEEVRASGAGDGDGVTQAVGTLAALATVYVR